MEKILNILKYNTYGLSNMTNKYIYMKRNDSLYKSYYIYHINSVKNEKFPIIYECSKGYCLIVPKNNKAAFTKDFTEIELLNSDILYNISIDEYLKIFKTFVNAEGTSVKIDESDFEH